MIRFLDNKKLNTLFFFILLLLICSPALSIVRVMGGIYLPNEKIASLLVVGAGFVGVTKVKNLEILVTLVLISILIVLMCIRIMGGGNYSITDINTVVFLFGLPFYIVFFKRYGSELVNVLPFVVFINLLASLFQQLCLLNDVGGLAMFLNNYPMQEEYVYPKGLNIFYRTSGLFNESSQYSVFLNVYVALYLFNLIKRTRFNLLILILSIVDILINESATAYLIFGSILFIYLYGIRNVYTKLIFFILLFLSSTILLPEYISSFFDKFINTYNRLEYYPRFDNMVLKILTVTNDSPIIGLGFTLDLPSWDFISVYYYAYGAIGLISMFIYFSDILLKYKNIFLLIIFINSFVAGNILISVNLILLLALIFANQSRDKNYKMDNV